MKKITKLLTVVHYERGNLSYYGNPSFFVTVRDENGEYFRGKTASNAVIGYEMSNYNKGEAALFTYHETRNGNIIFDYVRPWYDDNRDLKLAAMRAGWRERFAMDQISLDRGGLRVELVNGEKCYIFEYSADIPYQDANGATYNAARGEWVN